uniref:Uncharacterized protein n=1 Tax=Anopheles coluzzii TaxID=1518534 RepID=A0A8W7PTM3_ANOCL
MDPVPVRKGKDGSLGPGLKWTRQLTSLHPVPHTVSVEKGEEKWRGMEWTHGNSFGGKLPQTDPSGTGNATDSAPPPPPPVFRKGLNWMAGLNPAKPCAGSTYPRGPNDNVAVAPPLCTTTTHRSLVLLRGKIPEEIRKSHCRVPSTARH